MRTPRPVRRQLITGLVMLLVAATLAVSRPSPATAAVTHLHGFRATVHGFSSWYGSYEMGPLGTAWCIDHGIRSPDPAFAYAAADLSAVAADTRAAMAWVVGAHGHGRDRITHAAVMLVLHDLMGARYPYGQLDVDQLTPRGLAGFEGQEAAVLERARLLKADGMLHRHLRGPVGITVTMSATGDGAATVAVTVRDADGQPVAGVAVQVDAPSGRLASAGGTTEGDGTWRTTAHAGDLPLTLSATATVPRLTLDAWAPTTRPAQRVARPALDQLSGTATLAAPPPTTTTTSTTLPPPTTTPTTAAPPTTIPSTTTSTAPTTTVPVAVVVAPTTMTSTPAPPATVLSGPPVVATLPRTGTDVLALGLAALGLLLLGSAAVDTARHRASALGGIGHHGQHGGIRRR